MLKDKRIKVDEKLNELNKEIHAITIFRNVLADPVMEALSQYFAALKDHQNSYLLVDAYSNFARHLYAETENLSEYVLNLVTNDENAFIKRCALGKEISAIMKECVISELKIFEKLASLTPEDLASSVNYDGYLPQWTTSQINFEKAYFDRIANINKYGYGIYSKYYMFYVKDEKLVPVKHPDKQSLSDLIGYKLERQQVIDNTRALLEGKPAANVLLFGDAGTGKSSTVKAVANEFKDEGLRIIEIRKEQLWEIPAITDELNSVPLKFIIFIDDLTFNKNDDNFGTLKAILEGSVSARANNVVIYATSNRRHLVKESFSDRDGDDIHRNDTIQETISLSERFGLKISFGKPDKACYLDIARALAEKAGIKMDTDEFDILAERFALAKGGRSARGAKQFVDSLVSKM